MIKQSDSLIYGALAWYNNTSSKERLIVKPLCYITYSLGPLASASGLYKCGSGCVLFLLVTFSAEAEPIGGRLFAAIRKPRPRLLLHSREAGGHTALPDLRPTGVRRESAGTEARLSPSHFLRISANTLFALLDCAEQAIPRARRTCARFISVRPRCSRVWQSMRRNLGCHHRHNWNQEMPPTEYSPPHYSIGSRMRPANCSNL
jgi:hypothetical protein